MVFLYFDTPSFYAKTSFQCVIIEISPGNPVNPHPAIPAEDVVWLNEFVRERPDVPFTSALCALRRKLFPVDYEPCEWIEGTAVH